MWIDSHFLVIATICRVNDGFHVGALRASPIKVPRPLVRSRTYWAGLRRKLRQLIRGGNHAGKIWVSCSNNRCEGSVLFFLIVALLVLAVSHQNPR